MLSAYDAWIEQLQWQSSTQLASFAANTPRRDRFRDRAIARSV